MKNEYEIIKHNKLKPIKLFCVRLNYRRPHVHKEYEVGFILRGSATLRCESVHHQLQQGDLFVLNPNQPHEITAPNSATILSLQITPRFCADIFPEMVESEFESATPIKDLSAAQQESISSLLTSLSLRYFSREPYYEFLCMSLVCRLIHQLLCCCKRIPLSGTQKKLRIFTAKRLSYITTFVEEHYTEKVLLSDVSSSLDLSVSYLSHFIKENLGMTFQDYVSLLRYQRARELLHTDMRPLDICISSGFSDFRYLEKAFLKHCGQSFSTVYRMERESESLTHSSALLPEQSPASHNHQEFLNDAQCLALLPQG